MSKTISEDEAFSQLETMFPGYERPVLTDFLESNGKLSLLIQTGISARLSNSCLK